MGTDFQPYVGPRPFERTETDQNRFFGRDDEASDLLSLITAHSSVLFYSPSGAGKTSLVNAKLIPRLESAGFEVLTPVRVRGVHQQQSASQAGSNVYVLNVLRSWSEVGSSPAHGTGSTIPEFLKSRKRNAPARYDQAPRVLIFDQFEELFTSYQERSGDREDFFDQVGEALEDDRLLRVIFSMREDYVAELDPYSVLLPERLRTRYRLERLSAEDALLAVTKPLAGSEYSFADGVADQLVQNLLMVPVESPQGVVKIKGEWVEPVQLQVVCQTLWENCQESWATVGPSERKIITRQYLETFGDVDQALASFYETAIRRSLQGASVKEGDLRTWFERSLITSAGTRGTVFRGHTDTANIPNPVVDELVNQHIIRGEIRGGSRWYELTHDRFISPIKAANERWFLQHSGGRQTRRILETRAEQWARDGRRRENLLDEGELLEATRWLESPEASEIRPSDALGALIDKSRVASADNQAKAARRLRNLVVALLATAALLIGALVFAIWKGQQAASSAQEAAKSAEAAMHEANQAKEAESKAEKAKLKAEKAKEEASLRSAEVNKLNKQLALEKSRADLRSARAMNDEKLAKKNKTALGRLFSEREQAVANYQAAIDYSPGCYLRYALMTNLKEWEALESGFTALGEPIPASVIIRIRDIRSRLIDAGCLGQRWRSTAREASYPAEAIYRRIDRLFVLCDKLTSLSC
jgi:hypothetical protein